MLFEYLRTAIRTPRRRVRAVHRSVGSADVLEARQLLSAVTVQLSAAKDNTIYQADPDASNGSGEFLLVGTGLRSLVQFDVGSDTVPAGSTIIDAVLTLHAPNSSSGSSSVSVHKVYSSWGEAGSNASGDETIGDRARQFDATWIYSSYDGELWNSPGGDAAGSSASATVADSGAYEWLGDGLIDDIQSWIDNPAGNFGWLLQAGSGILTSFYSKDGPDSSLAPTLEITYEEPPPPPVTLEGRVWNDLNSDGVKNDSTVAALDLTIVGNNTYFNAFGGNEYWFRSGADSKWYFLTPDGTLTKWSGTGGTLSGQFAATLDPRFYQDPTLVTQDVVGDGEPWLNGWTVELVDSTGGVVDTAVTSGRDLNQDGAVNPETEGGWYSFQVPATETFTVRTVLPDGWAKTAELTLNSSTPAEEPVTNLQLRFRNSFYENFGGLGEKWMYSDDSGWYYITPSGELYRWNGRAVTDNAPLSGTLIGRPGTSYYDDPLLLANGFTEPGQEEDPETTTRTDFGVAASQTVRGRVWLDFYANGTRDNVALIPNHHVLYPLDPIGTDEEWFYNFENNDWYIINADGEARYWGPHEEENSNDFNRPGGTQQREFAQYTIEPWLNGKTIELLDKQGNVVATTQSRNVDVNNDGSIDLNTERGWYIFENVPAGDYTIRTAAEAGWKQTAPASAEQTTAANLDSQFDFRTTASDFRNWGGRNERWVIDQTNKWYYVLEDGSFYEWTVGTGQSNGGLQGTLIAHYTPEYHADLSLISNPQPASASIRVEPDKDPLELLFGTHQILGDLP